MQTKVAILHFQPLEGYPPAMNMINFLGEFKDLSLCCLSTHGHNAKRFHNAEAEIKRYGKVDKIHRTGIWIRILTYVRFNLGALWSLIKFKPNVVFYYETLSCWPAYVYKRFINRKASVFIHYHEYTSPFEFESGMKLVKYLHQLEKNLYPKTTWISHTNSFRLNKFKQDEINLPKEKLHIMPNYPPKDWSGLRSIQQSRDEVIKFVYVGYTLSFETMYVKEVFDFVALNKGIALLDCYIHKVSEQAATYLTDHSIENISLHRAVDYFDLKNVLPKYDVGLIFYKAHSDNVKYCASNKLFEYLACGLDVWFSKEMEGSMEYVWHESKPKVIGLDYERISKCSLESLLATPYTNFRKTDYNYQKIYLQIYLSMAI